MKKIKLIFWAIIFGLIGLIIFQNLDFFTSTQQFAINLWFYDYHTPEIPTGVLFLLFFLAGLLLAYLSNLIGRFKSARTIKGLNKTVKAYSDKIALLEDELASVKNISPPSGVASSGETPENY